MSTPEMSSPERIKIDSKEQLRSELGITSPMDIPEISLSFEVTRKDLEDFKKSLDTLPTQQQLEKIKAFIVEKSEVVSDTKDKADAFKKTLAIGGIGAMLTGMGDTLKEGMTDLQNAEGLDMVDKGSSLWDKMEKMWDKTKLAIAQTKIGKMFLEFFGFEVPSVESVMDGAEEKGKDALKKVKPLTEEKKQEVEEKIFETVSADLKKQYGLNPDEKLSDGTTKGKKLRLILKERAEGLHSQFIDTEGKIHVNLENISTLLMSGPGIIYDLFKEGVLDSSSMTFDFVNTAKGTVRYVVKSVSGIEIPSGLGGEISLDSMTDNMTTSEKMFLLAVFYRKGGFVSGVLGDIGYILAQPMRLLNSFDNIGTLSTRIPGFESKIQKMDQVIEMLTKIAPQNTADIAALKDMREAAKCSKEAIETVIKYQNKQILYPEAKAKLTKLSGTYQSLSWEKKLVGQALGFDAWNKAYLKDVFITNNVNYIKTLSETIESGFKNPTLAKIKAYGQFLEIPGDLNRTAMYFKTPEDFKGFIKEMGTLASQSPEFVRGFFTHLPVFIVAGVTIHEGMKPDGDMLKSLQYLIPIWGPFMMMSSFDTEIDTKDGTVKVKNLGDGIAGVALITLDGWILSKLLLSKGAWGAAEFAVKPVIDTGRALSSLARLSGSLLKVGADGVGLLARSLGKAPNIYVKLTAGALMGVSILALAGEEIIADSPEDIKKKLIEKKLLNADGTPNLLQMKEKFKTLKLEDRKQILDLVLSLEISAYRVDQYIESTEYKNGTYIIKTKKEHKSMVEKTLLATNIYSEFELVDNIQIETVGD